jgi:uncharacterized Zn-binding protein involved in type VI secretion
VNVATKPAGAPVNPTGPRTSVMNTVSAFTSVDVIDIPIYRLGAALTCTKVDAEVRLAPVLA